MPKGEGFVLRLKPVMVGHTADTQDPTTWELSSSDSGFWFPMYLFQAASVTFPRRPPIQDTRTHK